MAANRPKICLSGQDVFFILRKVAGIGVIFHTAGAVRLQNIKRTGIFGKCAVQVRVRVQRSSPPAQRRINQDTEITTEESVALFGK